MILAEVRCSNEVSFSSALSEDVSCGIDFIEGQHVHRPPAKIFIVITLQIRIMGILYNYT